MSSPTEAEMIPPLPDLTLEGRTEPHHPLRCVGGKFERDASGQWYRWRLTLRVEVQAGDALPLLPEPLQKLRPEIQQARAGRQQLPAYRIQPNLNVVVDLWTIQRAPNEDPRAISRLTRCVGAIEEIKLSASSRRVRIDYVLYLSTALEQGQAVLQVTNEQVVLALEHAPDGDDLDPSLFPDSDLRGGEE